MSFTPDQTNALQAPLSMSNVKRNPRGFDYIEGWQAIAEANRIFGHAEWNRTCEDIHQVGETREVDGKFRVAYFARVRIEVQHEPGNCVVLRDGCGYGSGIDRDLGQAHESAIKEAETDAMKRALMTFGNPFGLALYEKPSDSGERSNVTKAEPIAKPPSNSAYQAKKDGKGERAATLAGEIDDLASIAEAAQWRMAHNEEVASWPPKWQDHLWDKLNIHVDELRALDAKANGADADGVIDARGNTITGQGRGAAQEAAPASQ